MSGLFAGTAFEQPVTCEFCKLADCACPKDASGSARPLADQSPRVRREKRRGKWNTVVTGVEASPDAEPGDLKPLLKALRTTLGTGGGLGDGDGRKNAEIVLQGDHRDAVVAHLNALGYKAKASGG